MKTTTDRLRARVERARKRVEAELKAYDRHKETCILTGTGPTACTVHGRLWDALVEALGRRKEAEAALREERRHG